MLGTRTSSGLSETNCHRAEVRHGLSSMPNPRIARIYLPSRSAMTSGKAGNTGWRLEFEPSDAPFVEPLMGWTGTADTLSQVQLTFPTLDQAIRFAERQGVSYTVQVADGSSRRKRRAASPDPVFCQAMLQKLDLDELQESYGRAVYDATSRNGHFLTRSSRRCSRSNGKPRPTNTPDRSAMSHEYRLSPTHLGDSCAAPVRPDPTQTRHRIAFCWSDSDDLTGSK